MLNAIGSSVYLSPAGTGKSSGSLETQLDQYKIKLADWVSCPSCKTPEGKAKIAELTDKISEIKQRLEAADAANTPNAPNTPNIPADKGKAAPASANDKAGYRSSPAQPLPVGTVGSRLDVFA